MFNWDFVTEDVMKALADWFYNQVVGLLGTFFAQMGNMGVEIFELSWVQSIVEFFSRLAWALFGVSVVVACFEFAVEYSTGRSNIQHTAVNILKGFMAAGLFTTVPVRLYALSVSLQELLAIGVTGYGTSAQTVLSEVITSLYPNGPEAQTVWGALTMDLGFGNSPVAVLFYLIVMVYAVIKVFFASLKRGGILLIQIAVGSLYMFSVPRGYTDGFIQWIKQVIALCLTAFLQSTILMAGLLVFRSHPLLGIGIMLSASEVPRIAGAFGLDTSAKAHFSSVVYTANSVVNTTRSIANFSKAAA